ncbi:hypothetical protein [Sphingobium sp. LSP13-1-1.1]|uniref:hypothetical protein n=1 Tax=Sphingobium sp. LSP13-1-1.1 TaxID=3135234 RepID=UPI0034473912
MTVAAKSSKIDYIENGATLSFPLPFRFLDGSITVRRIFADGSISVLTNGADFSVSGGATDDGGTLTLTATVAGAKLRIRRRTPRRQSTNYTTGDRFPAETHEATVDRAMLIDQEQDDTIDDTATRALMVPDGETAVPVPAASDRAGKALGFDAQGKPIAVTISGVNDPSLRADLAGETGDALIGHKLPTGNPTADLAKVNAMIAATDPGGVVDLKGETFIVDSAPTNSRGKKLVNGRVLEPSRHPPYRTIKQSYADDIGYVIGRANQFPWRLSVCGGLYQQIYLFGHSWIEQNGLYTPRAHELVQQGLIAAGVDNCLVVGSGKGGASWSDVNVLPELDVDSVLAVGTRHVMFALFTNDVVKGIDQTIADFYATIAHVRAQTWGAASHLTITVIIVGNIDAPETQQDAQSYEQIRAACVQAVRLWDITVFDMYAYMWDSQNGRGIWLDAPGFHPDPVPTYAYWREGLAAHLFESGQWNNRKANQHWNIGHGVDQRFPTDTPQEYERGRTGYGVLTGEGWDANGSLLTYGHADGVTLQELVTLEPVPRILRRTGAATAWTQWANQKIALAPLNAWVDRGGGYRSSGCMATDRGTVLIWVNVKDGVSGSAAHQLPSALRPTQSFRVPCEGGYVTIFGVTGEIVPTVGSSAHVAISVEIPAV